MKKIARAILPTAIAICFIIIIVAFFVTPKMIIGSSMAPTLRDGDFVITFRYYYGETLERGKIISFWAPNLEDSLFLVKRVIGLPGETITVDEYGSVSINSTPLPEPYIYPLSVRQKDPPAHKDTMKVPQGCYYVLGDNRMHSWDSRKFEAVCNHIIDIVTIHHWPLRK